MHHNVLPLSITLITATVWGPRAATVRGPCTATVRGQHAATVMGPHAATVRGGRAATVRSQHAATVRGPHATVRGPHHFNAVKCMHNMCYMLICHACLTANWTCRSKANNS